MASRGTPNLFSVLERGADAVGWPQHQISATLTGTNPLMPPDKSTTYAAGVAHTAIPDVMALTVWLHRDVLLERLEGEIDAISDDTNALDHAGRIKREASITAAILDAERAEEWFSEQIEEEGQSVERRADLDPRAFLAITGPPIAGY